MAATNDRLSNSTSTRDWYASLTPAELAALTPEMERESERRWKAMSPDEQRRLVADAAAVRTDSPATITAIQLMGFRFEPQRWAIEGLIPEGLSLLAAKPKIGKSWLMLGTALAIASGGRALGQLPVDQGEALVLALEDTDRRLQLRLATILEDVDETPVGLHLATKWDRFDSGGLDALASWLRRHPRTRLVIIDTFARVRPKAKRREGPGYDDDYAAMASLKSLADEARVAIVVVHHTRKGKAEDVFDEVSGTLGLTGAADAVLILERARGEADARLHITGRDVEEATHALRWSGAAGTWSTVDKALADTTSERAEILRFLATQDGPRTPKAIAAALGKPDGTARRLCWSMAKDGQLFGGGRDGYDILRLSELSERNEPSEPSERSDPSSVRLPPSSVRLPPLIHAQSSLRYRKSETSAPSASPTTEAIDERTARVEDGTRAVARSTVHVERCDDFRAHQSAHHRVKGTDRFICEVCAPPKLALVEPFEGTVFP